MFKPYLTYKGKRYGYANGVKVFSKEISITSLHFLVALCVMFFCLVFMMLVGRNNITATISIIAIDLFAIYYFARPLRLSCVYCSINKEDVEQIIKKGSKNNPYFKDQITDIQFENGWYMIFNKSPKETEQAELQNPNTYIRECPSDIKKLSDKNIFLTSFVCVVVSLVMICLCECIFSLNEIFLECCLGVIFAIPFSMITWRVLLLDKCLCQFSKENHLDIEKDRISVQYNKMDGGRLIFKVKGPIKEEKE